MGPTLIDTPGGKSDALQLGVQLILGLTLDYFQQKNHERRRFLTGNVKIISENWGNVLFMKKVGVAKYNI